MESTNHIYERASASSTVGQHYDHTATDGIDRRQKRVWKACGRCRMKKLKCDSEYPCKRCEDSGLVCTVGVRRKVEYKQLPQGYAEVLENTQLALIATIHKLYNMVRNAKAWDHGEPHLNDRGLPVIHDIVQKLGCIQPISDTNNTIHSVLPDNEAAMTGLARQFEEWRSEDGKNQNDRGDAGDSCHQGDNRDSSDMDYFEFDDYAVAAFGSCNAMTLSSHRFVGSNEAAFSLTTGDFDPDMVFAQTPPSVATFSPSSFPEHQTGELYMAYHQHPEAMQNIARMNPDMVGAGFGTQVRFVAMSQFNALIGRSNPMISGGFDFC